MRYKALRRIDTKEFVHIDEINDNLMMYTAPFPYLLHETADIDGLEEYYLKYFPKSNEQPYFDQYELVDISCEITEEINADINNKLSPIKNLLAMLKEYKKETNEGKKFMIQLIIIRSIKDTEESIKYLTNLL